MPRTVSPSEIHSENALDYKQKMRDGIMKDLDTNISIYSRTVPKDARERIKDTVAKNIDAKIAEFEQAYLKMRTQRGEKITIQDMDDIMPYVQLAMLKELHIQIADTNSEGAKKLAGEIVKLEGEIKVAKAKVKTLRGELDTASAGVADTLKSLTKTDEYRALEKANQSLGKNTGAINAWKEVQKMADKGLDTTAIKKELNVLKSNAIKDQTKAIETYQILKEIQDDNTVGLINETSADAYIIRVGVLINSLDKNSYPQTILADQLTRYSKALGEIKTLTGGDMNGINFVEEISYSNGIGVGAVAEIEAIEEAEKLFASLGGDREKFRDAVNAKKAAAEGKKPGLEKNLRAAKAGFEKKVSALQPLIDAERAAARKLGRKQGEKKNLEKQKKGKTSEKELLESDSEMAQGLSKGQDKLKATIDASQKIRINARNLIVRSGPSKASEYLRTPDNKKAIMLQPGDIVTPLLDANGNIETAVDGPRDYTHVTLADGTEGWIALSDKLGGKFKQEYGDINLEDNKLDTSKSYILNGEDVRLRTGFSTRADTIDILDSKKVDHIHLIANPSEGDNAPEGSGLAWKMVEVTYRDGTTKTGYIAEKYLLEKPEIPFATKVAAMPGYVRTPFEPSKIVDVRGISPGSTARDPYTGKDFRVPMDIAQPAPATKPEEKPNRPMGEEPTSSALKKLFESVSPPAPKVEKEEVPEIPFGTPIEGRPGFVLSPFAAKHQLIDVTGLPVGMEVECPYTGKHFRVPPTDQMPSKRPQSKE